MPVLATFTLRNQDDWRAAVQLVRQQAAALAERGTPLRLVVSVKHVTRRLEQNASLWADVLEQISQQVCVDGQWFAPEIFHEYLKRKFLPDVCARGVEKWAYHADGSRSLQMSTGDLDDAEFREYVMAIMGHAASEWGVVFYDRDERPP